MLSLSGLLESCSQQSGALNKKPSKTVLNDKPNNIKLNKMKIEIWSDVLCPFCYIGKRKFEAALTDFSHRNMLEIEWKSYQLNPHQETNPNKNSIQALAENKGISLAESESMHKYVEEMAALVGLHYNMKNTIAANSFKAHRLTHYAKSQGKQQEIEEKLFESYFIQGKNIDDIPTLIALGVSAGLSEIELSKVLHSEQYSDDVRQDIYEASQIGVRGVPFFVFDNEVAISGAQESRVFLQTLEKSFEKWQKKNHKKPLQVIDGKVCTPNQDCE